MSEGSTEFAPKVRVSLGDVLARISDLYDMYIDVFEQRPYCYKASIHTDGDALRVHVLPTQFGLPDVSMIRQQFYLPDELAIVATNEYGEAGYKPTLDFRMPIASPSGGSVIHPSIQNNEHKDIFIVAPFSDSLRLSSLSTLYLVSYALGMLVRYYPRQWLALLTRQHGDWTFPVLREAMHIISRRVPQLILQELEG
jgi:hypothetical protein